MPAFNVNPVFLEEAWASVVAACVCLQRSYEADHPLAEFIVVNDGSTDEGRTAEWIEALAAKVRSC